MAADVNRPVRVVAIRRGHLRVTEFALRQGEGGLSMFACETEAEVRLVIDAVRSAGKTGRSPLRR
jgi:hypothetical protein